MNVLNLKAFGGLLFLLVVMAALLFIPAWTLDYWQAWAFLAVFFSSALAITAYLMKKDPKLLARRVHAGPTAEKETSQKIIQSITSLGFIAMLVIPALDHRFVWSTVSLYLEVAGEVLVAIGFLIVFLVYKENTFTSATIELGSWWGLFAFLLIMPALIWRIFDEEKLLARNLPGYLEYQKKVRCRLIPLVW